MATTERRAKRTKAKGKGKNKGHGRNGAKDYPGAEHVAVSHPELKASGPLPRATVPGQALRHPCGEQGCGAEGSAADPGDGVRAPDAAMRKLPEDVHSATFVSGLGEQVPSECGRGRFGVALCHGHAPPPPGAVAKVGGGSVCRLHAVRAGRSDGECRVPGLPPHGDDSRDQVSRDSLSLSAALRSYCRQATRSRRARSSIRPVTTCPIPIPPGSRTGRPCPTAGRGDRRRASILTPTVMLPPHETGEFHGAAGEGVAVDLEGNVYAAEGPNSRDTAEGGLTKYLKR